MLYEVITLQLLLEEVLLILFEQKFHHIIILGGYMKMGKEKFYEMVYH